MKIKSQYLALLAILFVGGLIGVLFFTPDTLNSLFSRSIDVTSGETIIEDQAEEPRPAVESLDGQQSEE